MEGGDEFTLVADDINAVLMAATGAADDAELELELVLE